jgi:hypothetical protein
MSNRYQSEIRTSVRFFTSEIRPRPCRERNGIAEQGESLLSLFSDQRETLDFAGKLGDYSRYKLFIFENLYSMAVGAVPSKPLSRPNSLLSGINTGIFERFATRMTSPDPSILLNLADFSYLSSKLGQVRTGI